MIPIIVDVIIIAILALCVFMGYKRGLAVCLIRVLAFFVAIAIAFALFKPVSAFVVSNTELDENIQSSIVKVFEDNEKEQKENAENEEEQKKNETSASLIVEYISNEVEKGAEEKKNEIVQSAASELTVRAIDVLSFIAIFIVVRILLIFVKMLTNLITKLPLIKECDKIGGIIYGVLQFLVIAFIALALINLVSTMTSNYSVVELINKSYIGSILNSNNILLNVIF